MWTRPGTQSGFWFRGIKAIPHEIATFGTLAIVKKDGYSATLHGRNWRKMYVFRQSSADEGLSFQKQVESCLRLSKTAAASTAYRQAIL